jgi:FdhD protein
MSITFERIRVRPGPDDHRLIENLVGTDHTGARIETKVPVERPLTLFLNGQEIVTALTIGDYPEDLAVGYFLNQGMPRPDEVITGAPWASSTPLGG